MICKKCGEQLPDNARFCGSCGSKLEPENVAEQIVNGEETNGTGQVGQQNQDLNNNTDVISNNVIISQNIQEDSGIGTTSTNSDNSKKTIGNPFLKISKPLKVVLVICIVGLIVIIPIIAISMEDTKQIDYHEDFYDDEYLNQEEMMNTTEDTRFYVFFNPENGDYQGSVQIQPGYVPKPEDPVREGYIFQGWYDENLEYEWDFDLDEAHESMSLYAKWTEETIETLENEKLVLAVDGLRLRETPDISGKKIALIPNGTRIIVTDTVNGWSYTTYKNKSGWCSSDYLFNPEDYEGEILFKAYVDNKNGLTMYVDQDTDSAVINNYISYKSIIDVYEVDGLWSYICYGNEYGWCLSEYLDDF